VGHIARMGERKNLYKRLVGKSERKSPVGTTTSGWEDNLRMDLRQITWEVADRTHLAQERDSGGLLRSWQ